MENTYTKDYAPGLEGNSLSTKENMLTIGAFILIAVALGAFTFYGVSMGYYPNLSVLS